VAVGGAAGGVGGVAVAVVVAGAAVAGGAVAAVADSFASVVDQWSVHVWIADSSHSLSKMYRLCCCVCGGG